MSETNTTKTKIHLVFKNFKEFLKHLLIDLFVIFVITCLIFGVMYAYTQNWPSIVTIESESMMHGDDSALGTIDTGDMVLVKKVTSKDDIITYMKGKKIGYKTYEDYGDVIIYKKNGGKEKPIIHRPLVWIKFNSSSGNFDCPKIGLYNQTRLTIENYSYRDETLIINFNQIRFDATLVPHDGFLTIGDHNKFCDQLFLYEKNNNGNLVEPVKIEWVIGKAEGELPWFGLIGLYITGNLPPKGAPPTSVMMLSISLILIVGLPISTNVVLNIRKKRKEKVPYKIAKVVPEETQITDALPVTIERPITRPEKVMRASRVMEQKLSYPGGVSVTGPIGETQVVELVGQKLPYSGESPVAKPIVVTPAIELTGQKLVYSDELPVAKPVKKMQAIDLTKSKVGAPKSKSP